MTMNQYVTRFESMNPTEDKIENEITQNWNSKSWERILFRKNDKNSIDEMNVKKWERQSKLSLVIEMCTGIKVNQYCIISLLICTLLSSGIRAAHLLLPAISEKRNKMSERINETMNYFKGDEINRRWWKWRRRRKSNEIRGSNQAHTYQPSSD